MTKGGSILRFSDHAPSFYGSRGREDGCRTLKRQGNLTAVCR
jgi:hypothetical protein